MMKSVIHVDGSINPERDAETIGIQLALADLETVGKRIESLSRQMKSGKTKELEILMVALEKAKTALGDGKALRELDWTEDELKELKQLQFLTMKPMLYVVNVDEGQMTDGSWKSKLPNLVQRTDIRVVPVCVKMEAELASMTDEEKKEYMETMGLMESGLDSAHQGCL